MKTVRDFTDYELIDSSSGERLERWGDIILIRPDPQIIWNTEKNHPLWERAHAQYFRSSSGGGKWKVYKPIPERWSVAYRDLKFHVKPMGFKHTGLFPEQAVNWNAFRELISKRGEPIKVLNLFAYTGGATLACAAAGAEVVHVDASKGMVNWARENADFSGLSNRPIRWIVDDCVKFVKREIRRGNKYHGIIMDPPSYGRGPNGEIWKLEEQIFPLVELCAQVLAEDGLFFAINSYSAGLSPSVMDYLLGVQIAPAFGGTTESYEIGLCVTESSRVLPCGSTAIWVGGK